MAQSYGPLTSLVGRHGTMCEQPPRLLQRPRSRSRSVPNRQVRPSAKKKSTQRVKGTKSQKNSLTPFVPLTLCVDSIIQFSGPSSDRPSSLDAQADNMPAVQQT